MLIPLTIPPGIVSDDTTFASAGRWADGNNVRFLRGMPQTIGGWASATSDVLTGVCRNVLSWTDNDGRLNIALGCHDGLFVLRDGEVYDITPTGLSAGAIDGASGTGYGAGDYGGGDYGEPALNSEARTWSLATYGQNLIASPKGGKIYRWENDSATIAAVVPNAPERNACVLVSPERQVLALGTEEEVSGDYNGLCIRGSNIEDPEDWTTSAANNAFEHIIEGGGKIITAKLFGAYVGVWTDNSVHLGQFVGELGQAYRFDRVAENCGAISPNAVAVLDQTAFWVGPDFQFRVWSLGAVPAILACPIRNDFKDHIETSQLAKVTASTIAQFGEVWWHYPDARDGSENSRYVGLCINEGPAWFRGEMARSAFSDAGVAGYPVGVDPSGNIYFHEYGNTANGGMLEWHIESADQYLGQAQQYLAVRGCRPDFEDQSGSIALTLSMRAYPQATATTYGPYALDEGQSKKDFRASGRVIALKFAGASAPSFARLGKPQFDVVPTGSR